MMEPHDCNWRDDIGCINSRCPLHRAMRTLAHNLARVASLVFATERVGSGRYCAFCDAPIPRESTRYCDRHGCLACGGAA